MTRTQTLYRVGILLVGSLFLSMLGYKIAAHYFSNEDRLIANFQRGLADSDFESMYAESSSFMKVNRTEAEFVERMRVVTEELRQYDPQLRFTRNTELEESMKCPGGRPYLCALYARDIRRDSDPGGSDGNAGYHLAFLEIGNPDKRATLYISWVGSGIQTRLFDLSLREDGSGVAKIYTLAGEPFR